MRRVLASVLVIGLLAAVPAGAAAGAGAPGAGGRHAAPAAPLPAPPGVTTLLSKPRGGAMPDGQSIEPSMSASGRYVAFTSIADNLVKNDTEGSVDVFVVDRRTGKVTKAPLPAGIARPPGSTVSDPSISADGRVVAFTYLPGASTTSTVGTVSRPFVVAWNRETGSASFVYLDGGGTPQPGSQPSVSGDGRYVALTTTVDQAGDKDGGQEDVVRVDRRNGKVVLVTPGLSGNPIGGFAREPSISADGNLVAFVSDGGDSVVDEDTGPGTQVYVRDIKRKVTEFISVGTGGDGARDDSADPVISGNGRYVAFSSQAANLTEEGGPGVFRRDRQAGRTILVSVTPTGAPADGLSAQPAITTDGSMVTWTSTAGDLVPETAGRIAPAATTIRTRSEVFIRDIAAGETVLVSVSTTNTGAGGTSFQSAVGGGGRYIAFASNSTTLVERETPSGYDVFLRELPPVPVINPGSLDLGSAAVDSTSAPLAATLGNAGWSALRVTGASITGANRKDFTVVADGCRGRALKRSEACTVSVVFAPKAGGARTAVLAVADVEPGSPRTVRLRGRATEVKRYNPRLELDPPIGQPGIVTIATGTGFPPNAPVTLAWTRGITPDLDGVVADASGGFTVPVLVFHNDLTGRRELRADPGGGEAFPPATAEMLVVKPAVIPPRFDLVRILDIPLFLVLRR